MAGPIDDSIGGGSFGQAVGLFVSEQWGRSRQEEGQIDGSHFGVFWRLRRSRRFIGSAESGGWELDSEIYNIRRASLTSELQL